MQKLQLLGMTRGIFQKAIIPAKEMQTWFIVSNLGRWGISLLYSNKIQIQAPSIIKSVVCYSSPLMKV